MPTDFQQSYLGRLRALVGPRLLQTPGARIVIERPDGRVLLQKRSDFGVWGVPGGNPEEGETILQAIVRETREETGLAIENPLVFGHASSPETEQITFPNGDRIHVYCLLFYATEFTGRLESVQPETLELGWFAPDGLPEMLPNMARTIAAYAAFRSNGVFQLI